MIDYKKLWYKTRELADKETLVKYPEYENLNDLDDYNRKVLIMKSNSIFWNMLDTQIEQELHDVIPQKSHLALLLYLFDLAVKEKYNIDPDWRKWRESSIGFCQDFFNKWSLENLDHAIMSNSWHVDFSSVDELWNLGDKKGILFFTDILRILKLDTSEVFSKGSAELEEGEYYCKIEIYKNKDKTGIGHVNLFLGRKNFIEDKMIKIGGDGGVATVFVYKRSREIIDINDLNKYKPFFAQAVGFTLNGFGEKCNKLIVYFDKDELNNACINESQWTNQLMENAFAWAKGKPTNPDVWVDEDWIQYGTLTLGKNFEWRSEQFVPANYYSEYYGNLLWIEMAEMIRNFINQAKPSIMDFLDSLGIEYSEDSLIPEEG